MNEGSEKFLVVNQSEIDDLCNKVDPEVKSGGIDDVKLTEIRESVFSLIIDNHLVEVFLNDLYDVEYIRSEEEESLFLSGMMQLNREQQLMAMSLPYEIRKRRLIAFFRAKVGLRDLAKRLYEEAQASGFIVGYHVSKYEIKPDNTGEWVINGSELDDRDDKPMAYYSLDYTNIYKKTRGNYIYLVRGQIGEDSTHKRDTSNNWGRASVLSVISRMENLSNIQAKVDKVIESLRARHNSDEPR